MATIASRSVRTPVGGAKTRDLSTTRRGYWSGAAYPDPAGIGLPSEDVDIEVEGGTAPAWLVRAPQESGIWAIMVHGRGAARSLAR